MVVRQSVSDKHPVNEVRLQHPWVVDEYCPDKDSPLFRIDLAGVDIERVFGMCDRLLKIVGRLANPKAIIPECYEYARK